MFLAIFQSLVLRSTVEFFALLYTCLIQLLLRFLFGFCARAAAALCLRCLFVRVRLLLLRLMRFCLVVCFCCFVLLFAWLGIVLFVAFMVFVGGCVCTFFCTKVYMLVCCYVFVEELKNATL